MLLYHGTTALVALQAMKGGLLPRSKTGNSNWDHTVESNPSCVYLSDAYAPYFAYVAAEKGAWGTPEGDWGIIEIDSEKLDQKRMLPDEDAMIYLLDEGDSVGVLAGMNEESGRRIIEKFYRDKLKDYQGFWKGSLQILGNCCYRGWLKPSAILRVATFNPKSNPLITFSAMDPSITPQNYKYCGKKYRDITAWFFGTPMPEDGRFKGLEDIPGMISKEEMAKYKVEMEDRSGLKIYDNRK